MAYKRLGALDIDGVTNLVNTDYILYTVPANKQAVLSVIEALNKRLTGAGNTSNVRVSHVQSGQTLSAKDYMLHDYPLSGKGSIELTARAMATGDFLVVRADKTDVNFCVWGDEV